MKITIDNFESFIDGSWDYCKETEKHTGIHIREINGDIGGGRVSVSDIDELRKYPDAKNITISGLHQDTFEYFIKTYGKQLRAIRFFKNKLVHDWSLLSTLPNLEFIYYFHNQRITNFWDMSDNTSLKGICISDFSRLKSLSGIEKAPNLEWFSFRDAVWDKNTVDSYKWFENTNVKYLDFGAKGILDTDMSFLYKTPKLEKFDFPTNMLSTEEIAWICANFPHLSGYSLKPYNAVELEEESGGENSPADVDMWCQIVGKRKPSFYLTGNEKRLEKYIEDFERSKKQYKNKTYKEAFLSI